jgi:hypothetical protein
MNLGSRIVSEDAPQMAHRLVERVVAHHHVTPDAVEQLTAVHGLRPALDQQHQEIEVAWNQRQLAPIAQQLPPRPRYDEAGEMKSGALHEPGEYEKTRRLRGCEPQDHGPTCWNASYPKV